MTVLIATSKDTTLSIPLTATRASCCRQNITHPHEYLLTASVAPVLHLLLSSDPSTEKWYTPYITFKRHSRKPWSELPLDIVRPLYILFRPTIILPSLAYALAFTYSNVLLTIEIPALLGRKEGLNAQQTGLQFIAAIIGSVLGEPIAGWGSDQFSKSAHALARIECSTTLS